MVARRVARGNVPLLSRALLHCLALGVDLRDELPRSTFYFHRRRLLRGGYPDIGYRQFPRSSAEATEPSPVGGA